MRPEEIIKFAREVYECGFWFTPRISAHTEELCRVFENALNKIYVKLGAKCFVSLSVLGVSVVVEKNRNS